MEDIDNIIIDSLKHLKCSIEDDVVSLKQFDIDLIIKSIMACLDTIVPDNGLPHSLPPSMSQRLKLGSAIADLIKELGFRGDIGYQTILYCNEVEARRLLMFLIERVPREPDKTPHREDTDQMSLTIKELRRTVAQGLKAVWVPSNILEYGIRHTGDCSFRASYSDSIPLRTTPLTVPDSEITKPAGLKEYNMQYLPDVTKQCDYDTLMPSLMFEKPHFIQESHVENILKLINHPGQCSQISLSDETATETIVEDADTMDVAEPISKPQANLATKNDVEIVKIRAASLQNELSELETRRLKLMSDKVEKEKLLAETVQQLDFKSKCHSLMTDEDNCEKLQGVVENDVQRLVELSQQWQEIQAPLLKTYRDLLEKVTLNETQILDIQNRLHATRLKTQKAKDELKDKSQTHAQLTEQCAKLSKQTNRSAYTRRIMEIISNIKKQSNDINKILKDTRDVQKEINSLSGQLERSFALSDEVIFRDAKQDETARKSYKLLATMHTEYEAVGRAVTELGSIIRESRNLQEQVDNEEAREISARLDRVMADLNQIKSETAKLLNKSQSK